MHMAAMHPLCECRRVFDGKGCRQRPAVLCRRDMCKAVRRDWISGSRIVEGALPWPFGGSCVLRAKNSGPVFMAVVLEGLGFFRQRAGYSRRKPAGFQGNSTFYGGKRPAQTMCSACEYSFLYIGYVARGKRPRSIGESPPEGFRLWWSFPFSRGGTPPPGRLGFLPMIPQIPAHGNTQESFFARAAGARLSPARNCQHRFLLKWGARWCILYAVYVQVRPQ